jgi:hypothetical protein
MKDSLLAFLIGYNSVQLLRWIINHWHEQVTHRLGLNKGYVVQWRRNDGVVMVAFECEACLKRTGIHPAHMGPFNRKP